MREPARRFERQKLTVAARMGVCAARAPRAVKPLHFTPDEVL